MKEEFLVPMGISQYRLAKEIGVTESRISAICQGKRAVGADTAARLARFFGTTAAFWLGLQGDRRGRAQPVCRAGEDSSLEDGGVRLVHAFVRDRHDGFFRCPLRSDES